MEFSHTYVGHSPLDESNSETFVFTLDSGRYKLHPMNGCIDYECIEHEHTWRVHMEKNQFGNRMVEIKRGFEQCFTIAFQVL